MILYDNPRNGDHKGRINADLYLVPKDVQRSKNTSSMYAYVWAYRDENFCHYLTDGWISLSSDSFVVDLY